ncbi:Afadin and alpha-actinin-binding-domain-containing protein [Cantharellus anzutake]|uniref:Afadin and alpha-actinin-binding-domain-containing protein n=1 Tax=Cantharellus anzutake TaxID=1750568 RepID=UPI001907B3A6|nr:Afadin and alpha-actinin-binding-domain-containing protein [Cantharellus anzutake]KAF8329372.1 Afadin and alpha-actinin-binding-domain-containing protein [Cantharellus anzutake]
MSNREESAKLVRWAFDAGSDGSVMSSVPSSPESSSSSTLAFVSAQLIAHGFARPPGLLGPLVGLSSKDQELVTKCFVSLLDQRISDMERNEDLTTRLNTLTYDHERLKSLYNAAKAETIQAQRETESIKSKHAITLRELTDAQAAQKQTCVSLQRAQSALQTSRQNAQNEIKRKERELERIIERWNKVSTDHQAKIGGMGANIKCSNLVADGVTVVPQANPILEKSLEQLRIERERMAEQNGDFRELIFSLVVGLDKLAKRNNPNPTIELNPVRDTTIFSPSPTPWVSDVLSARTVLHDLLLSIGEVIDSRPLCQTKGASMDGRLRAGELDVVAQEKLLQEVQNLRSELEETRKELTEERNKVLNTFMNDQRLLNGKPRISAGGDEMFEQMKDQRDREIKLEEREHALEDEKARLMAVAVELGKQRNALAAEKRDSEEQQRQLKLRQVLDDLPATPGPPTPSPAPGFSPTPSAAPTISVTSTSEKDDPPKGHPPTRRHVHRAKSPKKVSSGARMAGVIRHLRRRRSKQLLEIETLIEDDIAEAAQEELEELDMGTSPESSCNVVAPEVARMAPGVTAAVSNGFPAPAVGTPAPFISYLNETPTKPATILRKENPFDVILARSAQSAQEFQRTISPERPSSVTTVSNGRNPPALPPLSIQTTSSIVSKSAATVGESRTLPESSISPVLSAPAPTTPVSLSTAQQRIRQNPYAPVVPSPLSRILRMSDSPLDHSGCSGNDDIGPLKNSGTRWNLADVLEEEEDNGTVNIVRNPPASLAEELGLPPLNADHRGSPSAFEGGTRIRRTPSPRKLSAKEKGKAKMAVTGSPPSTSAAVHKIREKENTSPLKAKKITIGRRVVGGGGAVRTAMIPNLAPRRTIGAGGLRPTGVAARTAPVPASGFKSLRDEVKARQSTMSRQAPIS